MLSDLILIMNMVNLQLIGGYLLHLQNVNRFICFKIIQETFDLKVSKDFRQTTNPKCSHED